MSDNGWDQHKIDVLNRLDGIEESLREIKSDGKCMNKTLAKIYTEIAVIKAKAGAVAAIITVSLTVLYHLFGPLLK